MRVGLTGGIASGKSTVAEMLVELGAVLIDGDALAREVVARGTPGLAQVVEEFGEELLTPEGDLDRAALGRIVFSDESARRRLEAITHPLIFERYAELEAAAPPDAVVVHDIPLLAEAGRERAATFDAVIVVDVPAELQIERMMRDRGWTREDAESRIAAQASREDRLAIATYVIDNTGLSTNSGRRSGTSTPSSRNADPSILALCTQGGGCAEWPKLTGQRTDESPRQLVAEALVSRGTAESRVSAVRSGGSVVTALRRPGLGRRCGAASAAPLARAGAPARRRCRAWRRCRPACAAGRRSGRSGTG